MDAMIMDGSTLNSGAVACVQNITNPIQLAKHIMEKVVVIKWEIYNPKIGSMIILTFLSRKSRIKLHGT